MQKQQTDRPATSTCLVCSVDGARRAAYIRMWGINGRRRRYTDCKAHIASADNCYCLLLLLLLAQDSSKISFSCAC